MNVFKQLGFRARLSLAFGIVVFMLLCVAATAWWGLARQNKVTSTRFASDMAIHEAVNDMKALVLQHRRFEKDAFINLAGAEKRASYKLGRIGSGEITTTQDANRLLGSTGKAAIQGTESSLEALSESAERRVAEGDLTRRLAVMAGDTTSLMAQLKAMQHSLAQVVGDVRVNAESLSTASAQIAQGNQDLSSRTKEQASSLQQTAATMEQLGTTVKLNADNAQQANQLAQDASTVAARGGEVVGQVVETMKGISDSSRKITDIVAQISAASVEQSSGVGQVGDAIGQMDQVTQQNAALVEESAAAAESLKGQASAPVRAVSVFKLATA
jgi:methyl-accepting chemotaxis protein